MTDARRQLLERRFRAPGLVLAPMEGVHDPAMRALFCELGGLRWGVAPFVRVSQRPIEHAAILRHVPELGRGGAKGAPGEPHIPIDVQILGSDPANMATTARHAAELGAEAIDLNFGCPAKTVNRHEGGAALLRHPSKIAAIVAAVREAVPGHVAVSAKLRLGWEDPNDIDVNARAAAEAGADWLTVHGRTRAAGYRPFALWAPIGRLRAKLAIPVVANGDIFTVSDLVRCRAETGASHFMLGRGPLADPGLGPASALALGAAFQGDQAARGWGHHLGRYLALSQASEARPGSLAGRLKQWGMLARRLGGIDWIDGAKRLTCERAIVEAVEAWEQARLAVGRQ